METIEQPKCLGSFGMFMNDRKGHCDVCHFTKRCMEEAGIKGKKMLNDPKLTNKKPLVDQSSVHKNSIKCRHCGEHVAYAEDLMFYCMPHDGFPCPHCGKTAINGSGVTF